MNAESRFYRSVMQTARKQRCPGMTTEKGMTETDYIMLDNSWITRLLADSVGMHRAVFQEQEITPQIFSR